MKPLILTDIDGVIIQWQSALSYFALKHNLPTDRIIQVLTSEEFVSPSDLFGCSEEEGKKLIELYNSSDFIRYLAAYRDALIVINRMKQTYDFIGVTALGTSIQTKLNRRFNLNALFPSAFIDIKLCEYNDSKSELLKVTREEYSDRNIVAYIDDLPNHVDSAAEVLDCKIFFMVRGPRNRPKNRHFVVESWFDIELLIK
ncbi:hypothetical protein TH2_118 [Shewanella phage Thanatos-2]|nr:hypothetical protein TH2_118 [Shewanella phage Thanatos-2]